MRRYHCDVLVVGAGNAGMCSALSAREAGAEVLVVEKAPPEEAGGNTPFTGGAFRFVHNGPVDLEALTGQPCPEALGPYTPEQFRLELLEATGGRVARHLLETVVEDSRDTVSWLAGLGLRWELREAQPGRPPPSPGLALRARGGGPGLAQMLHRSARARGISLACNTRLVRLLTARGGVTGAVVADTEGEWEVRCGAVVLACGGFEASREMRARFLGPGWASARVRGTPHNQGQGILCALSIGAQMVGHLTGCHASPVALETPPWGTPQGVERWPRRSYPYGITVDLEGRRFLDEGEGPVEETFVEVARRIVERPRGVAFQVFDQKALPLLEPRYGSSRPAVAGTPAALARLLGVPPCALERTVEEFNRAVRPGPFDPTRPDGKGTQGLVPPKSNWALPLDTPPLVAYSVTAGITYTYGGLAVDSRARVLDVAGRPIPGLFAAGVIVGGWFYRASLRGTGLMMGAVLGRVAGREAASRAR